jgi:putative two-component system response regulator
VSTGVRSGASQPMQHPAKATPELATSRILAVDDEEDNVRVLSQMLRWAGYTDVALTSDPVEAVRLFDVHRPDLVLLDLRMPGLDGFGVMERMRVDPGDWIPILMLTGDLDPEVRERALSAGARDFITKPFDVGEVLQRIKNLLETRRLHLRLRRHADELEEKVRERTAQLAETQVEILRRLAVAAEFRDDATGEHAERVGALSALIAEEMGLSAETVELIRRAAPLHDVGKIGVPDAILMKPGPLTQPEFEVMKTHTEIGQRILGHGSFPLLQVAREIVASHHERWDGGGYRGQRGEDIPLAGRIVAVADTFDAVTHRRPYKEGTTAEEGVRRVREDAGRHFDPIVVEAFLRVVESGRLNEIVRYDSPAREGAPRELTAKTLQPGTTSDLSA